MDEAGVEVRETSSCEPPGEPGGPPGDIGSALLLAHELANRLLDLRMPSVHAIRLARGMMLNVVDVLEGLQAVNCTSQPCAEGEPFRPPPSQGDIAL